MVTCETPPRYLHLLMFQIWQEGKRVCRQARPYQTYTNPQGERPLASFASLSCCCAVWALDASFFRAFGSRWEIGWVDGLLGARMST